MENQLCSHLDGRRFYHHLTPSSPAPGDLRVSVARLGLRFHRHCFLYRHGRPEEPNLAPGGAGAIFLARVVRWSLSIPTLSDHNLKDLNPPPIPPPPFPLFPLKIELS